MNTIKAYKLIRKRKDGSLAPLFINKRLVIAIDKWLTAEFHPTKGYKERKGWHCTSKPIAPHLSEKNRVWCEVEIRDYEKLQRPVNQGGLWYLAQQMKVVKVLD